MEFNSGFNSGWQYNEPILLQRARVRYKHKLHLITSILYHEQIYYVMGHFLEYLRSSIWTSCNGEIMFDSYGVKLSYSI
jgi:hypothetical protein